MGRDSWRRNGGKGGERFWDVTSAPQARRCLLSRTDMKTDWIRCTTRVPHQVKLQIRARPINDLLRDL